MAAALRAGRAAALVVWLALGQEALAGGRIFVKADAPAGGDGQSWATAHAHLQDALKAARDSGGAVTEIWVAAGEYRPDRTAAQPNGSRDRSASFQLITGVAVRGGFAGDEDPAVFDLAGRNLRANRSVLSGDLAGDDNNGSSAENSYHVVVGSGTTLTAVLDGFTITRGNASKVGSTQYGGGMYNAGGSPTLLNCTFERNSAYIAEGIANTAASSPTLVNCVFAGGGGSANPWAVFNENTSKPTLINCTLAKNPSSYPAISSRLASAPTLVNCIVASSSPSISGSANVSYSCLSDTLPGEGNISADPLFVSLAGGDLRLSPRSPCLDIGNGSALPAGLSTDADGNPRVANARPGEMSRPAVDMGAYEFQPAPPERLFVRAGAAPGGDGASWATAFPLLQDALAAAKLRTGASEIWVARGAYRPDEDSAHPEGTGDRAATFQLISAVAVRGGFSGDEDPATFDPAQRNFDANRTILSGDLAGDDGPKFANNSENALHVVTGAGAAVTAVLDGFTVSGGNANMASGLANCGGGLVCSSGRPTLANCTFAENWAENGGGMYGRFCDSEVVNCAFRSNSAGTGGGLYASNANLKLANSTISGNLARSPSGGAGAYVDLGTPRFINCSIAANLTLGTLLPGGLKTSPGSILTNCIVWGNDGVQIQGTATVSYSCIQGGWPGEGNISADPMHVFTAGGNLRLRRGSPCIDAGSSAALPAAPLADPDGCARLGDDPDTPDSGQAGTPPRAVVDMGAYEYQPGPAERLYVKAGAAPGGDGSTWANAVPHLQDALRAAQTRPHVTEIWVAAGVYRPDQDAAHPTGSGDPSLFFRLPGGVELVGGFPGLPGQEGSRQVRRPTRDKSVLSGDLAGDDGPGFTKVEENSFTVLTGDGTGPKTLVDGFVLTGALGRASTTEYYAAMVNNVGSPTLLGCLFTGNYTTCLISNRSASLVANCAFWKNNHTGLIEMDGATRLVNCTFSENKQAVAFTGKGSATMTNCIAWGNRMTMLPSSLVVSSSCIQGGRAGMGNIGTDPRFANLAGGDLRLSPGSRCIDAGSNAAAPAGLTTDAAGRPRFIDDPAVEDCLNAPGGCGTAPVVDMGAFEYSGVATDLDQDGDVDGDDLRAFAACVSGPAVPAGEACVRDDLDRDGDTDQEDFGVFQRCYGGANQPPPAGC